MSTLIVGGLGGGGDVGLAAVLVEAYRLQDRIPAIVSFAKCVADSSRGIGRHVAGALMEVEPGASLNRRVFEDKLMQVAGWARRAFLVCTLNLWSDIVDALKLVYERYRARCMLHADLGGDALLMGYEKRLGSYETDAVARASLAWLSEEYGVRSVLALGGIGAEGGGEEIDAVDVAAVLQYLDARGIILGSLVPSVESLGVARMLLERAESGMLPLYLQAVEGRSVAKVNMAYLHGVYRIKPWYKYVLLLDAARHCRVSPLCEAAIGRGRRGIVKWRRRRPPQDLERIYRVLRRDMRKRGEEVVQETIMRIMDKYLGRFRLRERCF